MAIKKTFLLRMPMDLYEKIKGDACGRRMSINQYILDTMRCVSPDPPWGKSIRALEERVEALEKLLRKENQ